MSRPRPARPLRPRSLRGYRPFAAILMALALFLVHGARLSHALLVEHRVCEHGDLVHGDHAGHDARPAEGRARDAVDDERGDHRDDGEDHDHCDANAVVYHVPAPPLSVAAASLLTLDPPGGRALAGIRPIAQLPLAPKASPPAV